jgi:antitoxin component YwqK of YwqJK toxin-antitoxin module
MRKILFTLLFSFISLVSLSNEVVDSSMYDNGNIKERLVAVPGIDGDTYEYTMYYEDGSLRVFGEYNEFGVKSGVWKAYYNSGELQSFSFYSNGEKHGTWWTYNKDGSPQSKREFKRGKRHGEWLMYENDMLVVSEEYKKGKLKEGWEWDQDRGLIARCP